MSEKLEPTFIVCEIGKIEGRDFYGIVLKGEIEAVRQAGDLFGEKVTIAACARSASMTDATEALLDELEHGLEGVTPGLWIAFLAYYFGDKPCWAVGSIGLDTDLIAVDLPEELAAHIARCSPKNIRTLIDLARQAKKLEAERDEARRECEEFRSCLATQCGKTLVAEQRAAKAESELAAHMARQH